MLNLIQMTCTSSSFSAQSINRGSKTQTLETGHDLNIQVASKVWQHPSSTEAGKADRLLGCRDPQSRASLRVMF